MYCNNCGKQIPDDSAFCPECGRRSGAAQPAAAVTAPKKSNTPFIVMSVIASVMLICNIALTAILISNGTSLEESSGGWSSSHKNSSRDDDDDDHDYDDDYYDMASGGGWYPDNDDRYEEEHSDTSGGITADYFLGSWSYYTNGGKTERIVTFYSDGTFSGPLPYYYILPEKLSFHTLNNGQWTFLEQEQMLSALDIMYSFTPEKLVIETSANEFTIYFYDHFGGDCAGSCTLTRVK